MKVLWYGTSPPMNGKTSRVKVFCLCVVGVEMKPISCSYNEVISGGEYLLKVEGNKTQGSFTGCKVVYSDGQVVLKFSKLILSKVRCFCQSSSVFLNN